MFTRFVSKDYKALVLRRARFFFSLPIAVHVCVVALLIRLAKESRLPILTRHTRL